MELNRTRTIERTTKETSIRVTIDLDGSGSVTSDSGVPFLDHMLDCLGRHAQFDIVVACTGDVEVEPHHSVEDVGIVIGQGIREALGERKGIARFAHAYAPLDEALARVVVDVSGRPYFQWNGEFTEPMIGADFASSLIEEFWRALTVNAGLTVHIDLLRSRNAHHAAEAVFKAGALALNGSTRITRSSLSVPSTKGVLA